MGTLEEILLEAEELSEALEPSRVGFILVDYGIDEL